MNNNTALSICLKYGNYTTKGQEVIRKYFSSNNEGNRPIAHFEWTAEPEYDEKWLSEYASGNKCRFVVGIEEAEIGGCKMQGRGINTRWTWGVPVVEYRIAVRDYFNDNLVYSQHVQKATSINEACRFAKECGFDFAEPDDAEFLASLNEMILSEVNSNG